MTDDPFDGLKPEEPPQNVTNLSDFRNRPRQVNARQANASGRKSRFFSAADLDGKPVPPREWLVPDLIPAGTVTLLTGDGGTGKSLLALQLAVACALGKTWLGRGVSAGRVLFLSAEDDEAELHRRLWDVVQAEDAALSDLDHLSIRSLAGEDALLAALDLRSGILRASDLFRELDAFMGDLRPVVLVLDTLADLFPGNENDRAQARQFVGLLRGLAAWPRRKCRPCCCAIAHGNAGSCCPPPRHGRISRSSPLPPWKTSLASSKTWANSPWC
ncbi:AAA domain-containing protein [Gemmobacter aquatilis]|uniref:AAA domain-containing protein n=1 Tax=Gemmobacter aquatilis TaxID=933059 RepID=A0A1H7ZT27_9RHOB|nr:AAA family ATPase [Gemmobacter aquatilis]SEM61443.1 AAA domain-containing protein [Gemmobacter aquatilis]